MRLVTPEQLSVIWPKVVDWIDAAVAENQGDENTLDVLIAIARGHYGLWVGDDFAAVSQIINYPKQRVCTILYLGGELWGAVRAFAEAKVWCKANGIDVLRTYGRPGWERMTDLKRVGVILQVNL